MGLSEINRALVETVDWLRSIQANYKWGEVDQLELKLAGIQTSCVSIVTWGKQIENNAVQVRRDFLGSIYINAKHPVQSCLVHHVLTETVKLDILDINHLHFTSEVSLAILVIFFDCIHYPHV